eukprot:RCo000412
MGRARADQVGQQVEGDLVVILGVINLLALRGGLQGGVVALVRELHRERQLSTGNELVEGDDAAANVEPEVVHSRTEIAVLVHLLVQPRLLQVLLVVLQVHSSLRLHHLVVLLHDGLSGQAACLHGGVHALNSGRNQGACVVPSQQSTGHAQLRQALQPAFSDGASSVRNALATFESRADGRVGLEALELIIDGQIRVVVVQANHKPNVHTVLHVVVQEGPSKGVRRKRPASSVQDEPRLVLRGIHNPDFLDAQGVSLLLSLRVKVKLLVRVQFLSDRATAPLAENRLLGNQLHPGGITVLLVALLANTHVTDLDTLDGAVDVVQRCSSSEPREDLNAHLRRPLGHPAHHL